MTLSFPQADLIILNPDNALARVIDQGYERYFNGCWTRRKLVWLSQFLNKKGYSVLFCTKGGDIL